MLSSISSLFNIDVIILIPNIEFNIMGSGIILVSGPTRSGKSEWAEQLMHREDSVTYLATSDIKGDSEWIKRIKKHKDRRPERWKTIDINYDLIAKLNYLGKSESILLDSLGGFVSNYINTKENVWISICDEFLKEIAMFNSLVVIVIEETGWGVSPSTKIGNLFRDRLGILSQSLELISSDSWLVIQGRAINLKNISVPIKING
tara:strand:+ start:1584 stop:2198 length:615 start_codon:yes stop_codon:yes gene_type:complete